MFPTNDASQDRPASIKATGKSFPSGLAFKATSNRIFSKDTLGPKLTVLYFYPKDDTPGCVIEAGEFRDLHEEFLGLGVAVWGVSRDDVESHERFKAKMSLPFELVADEALALCEAFDTISWRKLYGRITPIPRRCTFVLDRDGRSVRQWLDVPYEGHAKRVLELLRSDIAP